jgi:hypothetical protein
LNEPASSAPATSGSTKLRCLARVRDEDRWYALRCPRRQNKQRLRLGPRCVSGRDPNFPELKCLGRSSPVPHQPRLNRMSVQAIAECNNDNSLERGEGWISGPSPPPLALAKAFSRSGCGRIFSLSSRVMQEGLSTGPCANWPGSGLSGPIFSGPHDCADLVNFSSRH